MKNTIKIFISVILLWAYVSCDYGNLQQIMSQQEQEIAKLAAECSRLNESVKSLSDLLAVIQSGDVVTSYAPIVEQGETVGYTLVFKNNGKIDLYFGKDGADGQPGAQGENGDDLTPSDLAIIPKQDTDGKWYWYYNGAFVTNSDNEKIEAKIENPGYAPQFKIEDGFWYLSEDNGKTWKRMDVPGSVSALENSVFSYVVKGKDCIYIYLSDGNCLCAQSKTPEDVGLIQKEQYDSLSAIASRNGILSGFSYTDDGCELYFSTGVFVLTLGEEYLFRAIEYNRDTLSILCRKDSADIAFLRKEAYYPESIVLIPDNSDGSVNISGKEDKVLSFSVRPLSTAFRYSALGAGAFKMMAVTTILKSAPEQFEFSVKDVSFAGELLNLTVETSCLPASFLEGTSGAGARLQMTSPDSCAFLSSYFPLKLSE